VNDPAFLEPMPGTKPSETIKTRDINTDKLERSNVKGTADLVTTKGPKDSQVASSSGQSVCEPVNKTKLLKKQAPGRSGFCYTSYIIWYTLVAYQASLVEPWFIFWRDVVKSKYSW